MSGVRPWPVCHRIVRHDDFSMNRRIVGPMASMRSFTAGGGIETRSRPTQSLLACCEKMRFRRGSEFPAPSGDAPKMWLLGGELFNHP